MNAETLNSGLAVGTEVVRVGGGPKQGCRGTVVETAGDRVRVYWHTRWNGQVNPAPMRTWVKLSIVRAV